MWKGKRTSANKPWIETEAILLSDLDKRPGHNSAVGGNRAKIGVTVQVIVLPADLNKQPFIFGQQ